MRLKKTHGLLVCLILLCSLTQAQTPLFDTSVKRVLFLGNSITYAAGYVQAIEAYHKAHFPQQKIEFINAGLPSETISGLSEVGHADGRFPRPDLHERLDRVLLQTQPDIVFASYGMNDGIYLPLDSLRFQKFKDGILWLHEQIEARGSKIIHLTPAPFDEIKGKKPGYAQVLDRYSEWLLQQKSWEVIDVHFPMQDFQTAQQKTDPNFSLAKDGVHPGELGHWIMAQYILTYLGQKNILQFPSIRDALSPIKDPNTFYQLVVKRHNLMKDAWLSSTGHLRPEMKKGLPLMEALALSLEIDKQIEALLAP
ncbi:SGNH/GDSL hydrolase family protein [Aquirufa ecclesiirivi]|uniref:SGNH/GDSL hydrolase family protein n=1 Tax=Aquirufa ecclesiirivi TaxID=2715124 RepID=A0ABT4JEW9_9BACT|nr:SGNH/GDSL hydrolase family protein [Aquirufa ecclesiirivi]MCZ2474829.1 SGNH/GDSL hydrolase family protein [Aquirufa ecclesiirivi]